MKLLPKMIMAAAVLVAAASVLPGPFATVKRAERRPWLIGAQLDVGARKLLERACQNCHSNLTAWPWYGNIAPVSWLLERDVENARKFMNFSDWPQYGAEGQAQLLAQSAAKLQNREMPPQRYLLLHPEAKLTDQERATLAALLLSESNQIRNGQAAGTTETPKL